MQIGMKGQAMVDTLVLFLVVSIVLVTMYIYVGDRARAFQGLRYESSLHQTTMLAILNYYFDFGYTRGTTKDLLMEMACYDTINPTLSAKLASDMSNEIKDRLKLINSKKDRHYIFYAEDEANKIALIHAYDLYPSVCISDIVISTFELEGTCSDGRPVKVKVEYGSWPYWKKVRQTC